MELYKTESFIGTGFLNIPLQTPDTNSQLPGRPPWLINPALSRGKMVAKPSRKAGLEGYRLHDCRHAHASIMLQQGENPKVVQERLSHARASITLDLYSHVTPGLQRTAAHRFNEALRVSREQAPILE